MKAVCLISGGMDSSTLAYYARREGYEILALHANYGQRTEAKERSCAQKIASLLEATDFTEIDLRYFENFGASSLTNRNMPVDRFDPARAHLPNTYVPFRNANLLAIATSYAEAKGADAIFIGVQALDYSGYPDCRPAFIDAFRKVIALGTKETTQIELFTPFITMTKTDILWLGKDLRVPYEHTWSCYQNEEKACGTCGSCHFRREAFAAIGEKDPIPYEVD
ncbi:7-cyano-7-deazaguanine synthase QueC [Methanoregula sp.]|uniref:7-cyano-7-deazaguanine synthase QueC n=1 Tax=Methanoregula sp. TaxID=2052170 RepID=UPI002CD869A9|nr:7-cyano-7-deazaguanine synthase QueC [Methanoregula sp.]HVP96588.1 7-cyano-7-deazaguanine synthase QueC [Methanoregula sp.]